MASRLNHLFQTAPLQFMQHTVLFVDGLTTAESTGQMRNKIVHCIDLEPTGQHLQVRARVLNAQHLYQDTPLVSYFVPAGGAITLIPRENPPQRFVFLPEFARGRLLIGSDGDSSLRLQIEENLAGSVPPAESGPDSQYLDSFAYWDYTTGHLVGVIRGVAILFKQPAEPWSIIMQQIVGTPGHEVVRRTFTRSLKLGCQRSFENVEI
jgi:hypothetical protein